MIEDCISKFLNFISRSILGFIEILFLLMTLIGFVLYSSPSFFFFFVHILLLNDFDKDI